MTFFLEVRTTELRKRPRREPYLSEYLRVVYACALASRCDWSDLVNNFYKWLLDDLHTIMEFYGGYD